MAWPVGTIKVPLAGWQVTDWSLPGPGIWGLAGPNGSGKSQFFSQLVAWGNKPQGLRVGLVMQNPRLQLTEATVWDQMTWPFQRGWSGRMKPAVATRAEQILAEWHLENYRTSAPWELSGGMQRRLALASMEILAPEVYLLDEPLEGLDLEHRVLLDTKLDQWSKTASVLVSSHVWQWLLVHTEWGWWCDQGLTWGRMGEIWYQHGLSPELPLEALWRRLLDKGAPVTPEAWANLERARNEVICICQNSHQIPSIP